MSRSNPSADKQSNPASLWLEWRGSAGCFRFYDKVKEENRLIKLPFRFIVLDQLATIRGFNKRSRVGIYSNEIRDTRAERLVVKFYSGATIAEGFYGEIKDKIIVNGGHFVTNCYIAYKDGEELKLGAIQFQGCSLGPWFEFVKNNREALYKQAVMVAQSKDGTSDDIKYKEPIFSLADVTPDTDTKAKALDAKLQEYLKGYLGRTRAEQVSTPATPSEAERPLPTDAEVEGLGAGDEATNIPF